MHQLHVHAARLFVVVASILSFAASASAESVIKSEGERFVGAGFAQSNTVASGAQVRAIAQNGTAQTTMSGAVSWLAVSLGGTACQGNPRARVTFDGAVVADLEVKGDGTLRVYATNLTPSKASPEHTVGITFTNDVVKASCDRNLWVDYAWAVVEPPTNVTRLYVDRINNPALTQADIRRKSRPADAALMDKLGARSVAVWLGNWSGDERALENAMAEANRTNARLVLVLYGIPVRDAGGYSAGGHDSSDDYRSWIDWIVATLGSTPALTIIEPDAVAMDVTTTIRKERDALLRYATSKIGELDNNRVYLDAGNSAWRTPGQIAARLKSAGIASADGFSLNVSNYFTTKSQVDYGIQIRDQLGGDYHFVVDTSRNGNGPLDGASGEASWCNPPGRAVGSQPTMATGVPKVDAFIWAKRPGGSDGACRGLPAAGTFMPEWALQMIKGAAW